MVYCSLGFHFLKRLVSASILEEKEKDCPSDQPLKYFPKLISIKLSLYFLFSIIDYIYLQIHNMFVIYFYSLTFFVIILTVPAKASVPKLLIEALQ